MFIFVLGKNKGDASSGFFRDTVCLEKFIGTQRGITVTFIYTGDYESCSVQQIWFDVSRKVAVILVADGGQRMLSVEERCVQLGGSISHNPHKRISPLIRKMKMS
ncbi:hypothetical protein K1719_024382 [Acacia pycnantha]|nr:hypothetical protein K1719_024382 [Acacia pycnantha]